METKALELLKGAPDYLVIALVMIYIAGRLYFAWREAKEHEKAARWQAIMEHVPAAHRLAERAAQQTDTPKDDLFVSALGKVLKIAGVVLDEDEVTAAKALGSAEHQQYKADLAFRKVEQVGKPQDLQPGSDNT